MEKFFEQLAMRVKSENSLSDITWVFCESDIQFKILFLQFFFPDDDKLTEEKLKEADPFKREFTSGDSRPDFFQEIEGKQYIIEVKIQDRNYHFEQYRIAFPNASFGWISNYFVDKEDDSISIKKWDAFHKYLSDNMEKVSNSELVKGYLAYLAKILNMFNFDKATLEANPLGTVKLINSIVDQITNNYSTIRYRKYTDGYDHVLVSNFCDSFIIGEYFELKCKNKSYCGWLGIVYEFDRQYFLISFKEKWNKDLVVAYSEVGRKFEHHTCNYYDFYNNGTESILDFQMNPVQYDKIKDSKSFNDQIKLLNEFYKGVLDYVTGLL